MSALFKLPARVSKLDTVDQVEWLKDYKKAIEKSIKTAQQRAVDEGLAVYVVTERENAPNKATFIAEFGEKVWARMCHRTEVRTWRAKS
jgi:hypothetical protein